MPIVHFIEFLAKADIEVYTQYPLSAALVTVAAFVWFLQFRSDNYLSDLFKNWPNSFYELVNELGPKNILFFLLIWSILVPIVGFLLAALGRLWELFAEALTGAMRALSFFYDIFADHPLLVSAILAASVLLYFVPNRFWPRRISEWWENQVLKLACFVAGIALIISIAAPFANLIEGPSQHAPSSALPEKQ